MTNRVEQRIMNELKNEWNEWYGDMWLGRDDAKVEVELASGEIMSGLAKSFDWCYDDPYAITRWRWAMETPEADPINPPHYKVIPPKSYRKHPDGMEYMDLMVHILPHLDGVVGHLVGQQLKYLIRLGKKDAIEQDAKKAAWYANYLVKHLESKKND